MTDDKKAPTVLKEPASVVFVTGPSGGGRTTSINVLEDLGYETIINLPLRYVSRLLKDEIPKQPMALGLDVRNRDFSVDGVLDMIRDLSKSEDIRPEVLFVECSHEVLLRRYSETRRRHPMAEEDSPHVGIQTEVEMLKPIRARADIVIDTTDFSPHDLKAELKRWFMPEGHLPLSIAVESFSYKRGMPRGMDMVFDCRFLRNPHWSPTLREKTGKDSDVTAYINEDPLFADYFERISEMMDMMLPALQKEGRAHVAIGVGCTGGKHRSVAMVEKLGKALAHKDWQVSIRHRELERQPTGAGATT